MKVEILLFVIIARCALCQVGQKSEAQEQEAQLPLEQQYQLDISQPILQAVSQVKSKLFDYLYPSIEGQSECAIRPFTQFKQCGNSWSDDYLPGGKTICQVGCLMSSVSMALNTRGTTLNGQIANPGTFNSWLKSHGGYQGNLYVWGAIETYLGYHYCGQFNNLEAVKEDVCNPDKIVILNVHNGGHWVLATGVSGDTFHVNDPGYNTYSYDISEVVLAAIYDVPKRK